MRVQRAPRAAEQPQVAPPGYAPRRAGGDLLPLVMADVAPNTADGSGIRGSLALDLTTALRRVDEHEMLVEVVAALVTACREAGLLDDSSALRLVRLTNDGPREVQLDAAVRQSAFAISAALAAPAVALSSAATGALTVVDLTATRVRVAGDWGGGGRAVATLGPMTTAVVPHQQGALGLSVGVRRTATLTLAVAAPVLAASVVVQVLEAVARSVEGAGAPAPAVVVP